jgi:hypothetical protein
LGLNTRLVAVCYLANMETKPTLTPAQRETLRREVRQDLEKFTQAEIRRQLGEKATRELVQEVCGDVLLKFFRTLTSRPNFWK